MILFVFGSELLLLSPNWRIRSRKSLIRQTKQIGTGSRSSHFLFVRNNSSCQLKSENRFLFVLRLFLREGVVSAFIKGCFEVERFCNWISRQVRWPFVNLFLQTYPKPLANQNFLWVFLSKVRKIKCKRMFLIQWCMYLFDQILILFCSIYYWARVCFILFESFVFFP